MSHFTDEELIQGHLDNGMSRAEILAIFENPLIHSDRLKRARQYLGLDDEPTD